MEFSTPQNMEIDTKIIKIEQVQTIPWGKTLSVGRFGGHLEKWPPS